MAKDVDDYLKSVSEPNRSAVENLRKTIRSVLPDATEVISYGIPMFKHEGSGVVAYNATKTGGSLQVMSGELLDAHEEELAGFKRSKGAVQFTPDRPLPAPLVRRLVKERLAENKAREKAKKAT